MRNTRYNIYSKEQLASMAIEYEGKLSQIPDEIKLYKK